MAPVAPVRDHDDLTSIKSGKDGLPALSLRLQAFPRIAKSRFNRSPSPVACSFSQQPQNLHHITLTPQDEGGECGHKTTLCLEHRSPACSMMRLV